MAYFIVTSLLKIVGILFLVILPMVSYSVYAERRVSAFIQDRRGPNRVGPAGLFQPIRSFSTNRRHLQIAVERRFHSADRKHILLLARAVSRDDAGDYHHRRCSFW